MPIERILIVDDEELMSRFLTEALARQGYEVESAPTGKKGLALLKEHSFDLLLTDVRMPDMSGTELLRRAKELNPALQVIVMTAYGSIENAVEAMQLGAFHYILKPFTPDALYALLMKANEHKSLAQENSFLREENLSKGQENRIIAESPTMKKILQEAFKVAKSHANVLLHGESGTGKEVVAAAIHRHSSRVNQPYIRVNCAAIPDTLIESEFFGHEKGAFTGAVAKKAGRFELAHRGTILLDEVTEIPLQLQPKLLRVLQEEEFERVGGTRPVAVDVRVISTSNRNLKQAIADKIFREDLYYRLNVIPIYLPPLRDRRDDIIPLSRYFLTKFCKENGRSLKALSQAAEKRLLAYPWPGNIRELANIIERVVVLDRGPTLFPDDLPLE